MQVSEKSYNPTESTCRLGENEVIHNNQISLIGFTIKGFKLSYYHNDKNQYCTFSTYYDSIESYALHEKFYDSKLWDYTLEIKGSYYRNSIKVKIFLNAEFVDKYFGNSIGLSYLVLVEYNRIKKISNPSIDDKSYLPYSIANNQPEGFKIKLYNYQLQSLGKMLSIENNNILRVVSQTSMINLGESQIMFDPVKGCRVNEEIYIKLYSKGGILADEMGLGKTITSLALVKSNPKILNQNNYFISYQINSSKIISKATLLICPSHLAKQWADEVNKCLPKLKVVLIRTKTNHGKVSYDDIRNADLVIITQQFLMNFKYYPALRYRYVTASSFRFSHRNDHMKNLLKQWRATSYNPDIENSDDLLYSNVNSDQKKEWEFFKNYSAPIFEMFHFHRVLVDEGHEIFGECLGNQAMSNFISKYLRSIEADYYWYISGTPFQNKRGMINCLDFIKLKLITKDNNILYYGNNSSKIYDFLLKDDFINNLLPQVCIRHKKTDVENQVEIPGFEEEIIWVKMSNLERKLYDTKKEKTGCITLQQLCCHPLVADSFQTILGNRTVSLDEIQKELIEHHENTIKKYSQKLENLNPSSQEYHMLKSTFTNKLSESKYILGVLKNMTEELEDNDEENECKICYCEIENLALTVCGHKFCFECLEESLKIKKSCPICRADLKGKEIMLKDQKKKEDEDENENLDPLINKYGSKLGKIIIMIKKLIARKETRIIVFSQWDRMLSLIGRSLAENGINNSFVKGNVYCRNAAITKFKNGVNKYGEENKVILLSLKNSASGTNLTEASHIFFVEPVNASRIESKAIEGQAICRACRLGQKNKIKVIRVLTKDTIEQDIYSKYYLNNSTDSSVYSDTDVPINSLHNGIEI